MAYTKVCYWLKNLVIYKLSWLALRVLGIHLKTRLFVCCGLIHLLSVTARMNYTMKTCDVFENEEIILAKRWPVDGLLRASIHLICVDYLFVC
jgi:hypothetical protein